MTRRRSRRDMITAAIFGLGGLAVGCSPERPGPPVSGGRPAAAAATATPDGSSPGTPAETVAARPHATATHLPAATATATPRPAGDESRTLLPDTPWATEAVVHASGIAGPTLVVLGGVHGNEPGGWLAAEAAAVWTPTTGVLAVVPNANVRAMAAFQRLIDGEGDLNRAYPGSLDADIPMERMAAAIIALCRELGADVLLDLHESWAHYVDRSDGAGGTAYLGQTITGGVGPRAAIAQELAEAVNTGLASERDRLIPRDGRPFRRSAGSGRGRSSLSLGGHVPGLTPVLVEMAQQDTPLERRVEMHLAVVRATMDLLAM